MAHLGNDGGGLVQTLLRQGLHRVAQGMHLALGLLGADQVLVDVRPDDRGLQVLQAVLFDDVVNDVERALHMDAAACAAGGTDDHGDAQTGAFGNDQLQILEHGGVADDSNALAQLMRACVGAAGVHHDGVRLLRDPSHERFLREAVSQDTARSEDLNAFHICSPFFTKSSFL